MKRSVVFLLFLVASAVANADSYNLATVNGKNEGLGTAFCVANTSYGSLMVTAGHVVEDTNNVFISYNGKWIQGKSIRRSTTDDVATFEVPVRLRVSPMASLFPSDGVAVVVEGKGPDYQETDEDYTFTGKTAEKGVIVSDCSVVQGDSGGPVYAETKSSGMVVVGVVSGYSKKRRDRIETHVVPAETVVAFIQTQYGGCPNGYCPIQIRPQVQQPMIGIGIPVGPPRTIGVAEPVSPIYVPKQQEVAPPPPKEVVAGPQGPAGRDGKDGRSVTKEEVESIVTAWLDSHKDELVGPPGPRGSGPTMQEMIPVIVQAIDATIAENPDRFRGPQGERGMIGMPNSEEMTKWANTWMDNDPRVKQLISRIDELEKRKITIVQGEEQPDGSITQIGESRSYDLNKPIPIVTKRVDVKDGK